MNTADKIAEWLEQKDIRHCFGIIGGGNVALFDAIARRGFTRIICLHHEQAAAMAATYYYRTCGRLALCLVTTGAGSSNAITGVLAAWMDSVPLLVISGNEASKYTDLKYMDAKTRVLGVQGYDSSDFAWPIVKDSERVLTKEMLLPLLDDYYKQAMEPRQGPVWLDIPKDIQNATY